MDAKIVLGIAIAGLAFLAYTPKVSGECCLPSFTNKCADCIGTYVGDYYCAADGSCNAFGCNCDGGCRRGPCRRKRAVDDRGNSAGDVHAEDAVEEVTGKDVVSWADADGNGALDAHEVMKHFERRGVVMEIDVWRSLDADGDGKLTPREIDADLA